MSDDPEQTGQPDPIQALRDEMAEQFAQLKSSFESQISERDARIVELTEQNTSLQRALVRSAMTEPPKAPENKTEKEVYDDTIKALAEKTLMYMSR